MTTHLRKITVFLWYDHEAEDAAKFYAATFPSSSIGTIARAPADYPGGKEGNVLTVEFSVLGIPCVGLNGGPAFQHNESFSFQISTQDQQETDRYWHAIVSNGGKEGACGWCKDRWGISWQITPVLLTQSLSDADPLARKRVFEAMMKMTKLDVAALAAARRG